MEDVSRIHALVAQPRGTRPGLLVDVADRAPSRAGAAQPLASAPRETAATLVSPPLPVPPLDRRASSVGDGALDELNWLIAWDRATAYQWQLACKRIFDLAVASLLLILLSPCLLVIALALRLTSPGPVIFAQTRVGRYGRPFTMFKFRTMVSEAGRTTDYHPGTPHKRRDDPRVTPVGRILRRTSLDELPQLINVLKGDMSLVGPRPELPGIVQHYAPWQYGRLAMPPGVTGWWQVHGRGERPLHLHTEDDLYYIEHFSLLLDARVLIMTLGAIVSGEGAF